MCSEPPELIAEMDIPSMKLTRNKPYAAACDENGAPILEVLRPRLPPFGDLLEIGSGTGQHAVMFATALPGIVWQTSDMVSMHAGIRLWLEEAGTAQSSAAAGP